VHAADRGSRVRYLASNWLIPRTAFGKSGILVPPVIAIENHGIIMFCNREHDDNWNWGSPIFRQTHIDGLLEMDGL